MIVIADDITGAAELAGITHENGSGVCLLCGCSSGAGHDCSVACDSVAACGTTVIATDTRSMTEREAVVETRRIVSLLSPLTSHLFKKTDSALRGHVVAELEALMQATGFRRSVYVPANPSKGRIIRNGVYYIKEVSGEQQEVRDIPIHETAFSYDPEFPARTSVLKERFPQAEANGIIMPDAESEDDIRRVITQYDDGETLYAGAADLFKAWLEVKGKKLEKTPKTENSMPPHHTPLSSTLILCGSTQSKPIDIGIPIVAMPREVYDGEQTAADWFAQLSACLSLWRGVEGESLILTIPHTHRTGKAIAVHLRTTMAEMTRLLVARHRPDHLIIEGGATAWATLHALGWTTFEIQRQVAPGVVQMSATNGTLVTLKPGSYPWGGLFQSFSE